MNYIIETELSIGEIVVPRLSPEVKYYVIGFEVMSADNAGNVTTYIVHCCGGDGQIVKMYEYELESITVNQGE